MIINTNTMNTAAGTDRAARAEQVAKDFEAMFTSIMFKAMRGSANNNENSLIPKNMGENIFTEMLDAEYARQSAERGSLGLANLILKEIQRSEGISIPSLDNDANTPLWAMERRGVPHRSPAPYSSAGSTALINRVRGNWESLITDISKRFGVDENLVTAVIARESAGNPRAISPKGAKGLMQLMDGTAREMGVKYSFSPAENIMGGVKYLKKMLDMHNGDERLALASYNAGPGAVRKFNGIPPYKETQEYVRAVLSLKARAARSDAADTVNDNTAADNGAKGEAI